MSKSQGGAHWPLRAQGQFLTLHHAMLKFIHDPYFPAALII